MKNTNIILGVDTGGTFTDFVLYQNQQIRLHKLLSTPHAPEEAILQGIKDLDLENKLENLSIVHGSTVATNAVLERKGVATVYIANKGLADILTIGRQNRKELYNLTPIPVPPPVPKSHCLEIDVRLDYRGQHINTLTTDKLQKLAQETYKLKPQAIAINLLYSYTNAEDEIRIKDYLENYFHKRNQTIFIACSSEVLPEYKEYERGISTWINAWVGPKVSSYLQRLKKGVQQAKLTVMQSSGGTMSIDYAAKHAVRMLLSGPAGGLAAAQFILSHHLNDKEILTFDMGGTSTDVALVGCQLTLTNRGKIGDYPVSVPMVEMHTIGAGGGSIAYVDSGGLLQVGPQSAGASPGPACYNQGGTQATVTDANLVLGRILADHFLGGKMQLLPEKSEQAIDELAQQLKLTRFETAQGIIDIANEHMTRALRVMSVNKGINPAQLVLMPFGGAGALHVCALAENLNMKSAIIPAHSGVLSAFGMLVAPSSRDLSKTYQVLLDGNQSVLEQPVSSILNNLKQQGVDELFAEGHHKNTINSSYVLDCRYQGQSYTLGISLTEREIESKQYIESIIKRFHQEHRLRYGIEHDLIVELVTCRVHVYSKHSEFKLNFDLSNDNNSSAKSQANSDDIAIYIRDKLNTEQIINGPALIIETVATTYLEKHWTCQKDKHGHLHLKKIS
ncbi:MAG: hydantoinase/oxoprolinase family protein [Gammaproteobacteria bacterium]|nr:hydantoinase/oxoprolinase family protein [Gammaproteobacteria bacterium]